jgi:hypothetical protein
VAARRTGVPAAKGGTEGTCLRLIAAKITCR